MIYLEELIQQKFQRPLDDIMAELKPKALIVEAGPHFVNSHNYTVDGYERYQEVLRERLPDFVAISKMVIIYSEINE